MQMLDLIEIDNERFLGAALWTAFCATGNSPLATSEPQAQMSDYRHIWTFYVHRASFSLPKIHPLTLFDSWKKMP